MAKTKVRGVTKFNEFKSGNVIRVTLTNGQELRGLYAGDVAYRAGTYRPYERVKKGQYIIIYDVKERKPVIIDVLEHCQRHNTHIQEVGSSRLKKELSDFLRAYHREYVKYQEQQKQAVDAITKSDVYQSKLKEAESGGIPEDLQKTLEQDYYQQNPKEQIKDKILRGSGFSGYEQREGLYNLSSYLDKAQYVQAEDLGASTFLEYDDTRHVDSGVDQKTAERYLNNNGYRKISLEQYKKIGNKYKKFATFSDTFLDMDLSDKGGGRVYPTVSFSIEIKDMNKVKLEQINSLINDINKLYKQVTYFQEVRRRGFW